MRIPSRCASCPTLNISDTWFWKVGQNFKSKEIAKSTGLLPRNCRCKVPEQTNGRQQKRAQRQWLLPHSLLVFIAQLNQHIDGKDTVTEGSPETDTDMHNTLQTTGPETDIGMHNIGTAPCPSAAASSYPSAASARASPQLSLPSTSQVPRSTPPVLSPLVLGYSDGWRWWPSKDSGSSSSPGKWLTKDHQQGVTTTVRRGYAQSGKSQAVEPQQVVTTPFGDGYTQAKPGTNGPAGSLRSLPGGGPGERVPVGHSSGCPLLLSERLFASSLRRQGVQGQVFRLRFPQVHPVRAWRFQGSRQDRLYSAPSLQLQLANRRFHFPQDLDWQTIPIATATPRATLRGSPGTRVPGRSVGLSFPRAERERFRRRARSSSVGLRGGHQCMEVRRHPHRPRKSTTSIAAERVREPVQDQPVREGLSYQNVQARLGQGKRQGQVQGHLRAQAGLPLQARAGLPRRRDDFQV